MTFHPLGTRILVRPEQLEQPGTITLVRSYEPPAVMGTVVVVGPETTEVNPGERVIFSPHVGQEIRIDDETLLIVYESDLSAVVTGDLTECPYCQTPLEAHHG